MKLLQVSPVSKEANRCSTPAAQGSIACGNYDFADPLADSAGVLLGVSGRWGECRQSNLGELPARLLAPLASKQRATAATAPQRVQFANGVARFLASSGEHSAATAPKRIQFMNDGEL